MKRFGKCFVLFCLFAVLLSATASANSAAPDYRVVVKVVNGPEELYYLDLLEESDGEAEIFQREGMDPELLEMMRDAVPEGWRACTMSASQWEDHYQGDLAGENGVHVFHGFHTPRVFRIIVVTESGESWISEPMEREFMNSTVKVDWEGKTAVMPPNWLMYALQLLSTVLPTLLIEGLLLLAFRFSWKKNWRVFLLVNLVTQGALSVVLCLNATQNFAGYVGFAMLIMIPVEVLIAVAETVAYLKFLRGGSEKRTIAYGITANVVSYVAGLLIVGPVYTGIVALMERIF